MNNLTPQEAEHAAQAFRDDYAKVQQQIASVIVGHEDVVAGVLTCLFVGGHALLEGVPGLGKTLLVRTLSEAVELDFRRIQFTPDLMPADITGTEVVREVDGKLSFVFERGPVFTQVLLADEINRATPKTQSALLEAMQEKSVTVGGHTYELGRPFFVMATQNPIEQEGVYPLPEAQLDRFLFKLIVGTSSRAQLAEVLNRTTSGATPAVERVLGADQLIAHQQLVRQVAIAPHVQDYAVRTVLATHAGEEFATPTVNKYVRAGASPRAAQALVLGAKCAALIDGRPAASIDDIRNIAKPALRHRILLNFEGESEGVRTDDVVANIVETLPTDVPLPA